MVELKVIHKISTITHRGHTIYVIYCYSKICNYFLSVLEEKKRFRLFPNDTNARI